MRLPTNLEMSVAANYHNELSLLSGNYWTSYGDRNPEDVTQLNCYMPTGNCGELNANQKQRYRCVQGAWPTKTVYNDKDIQELD